MRATANKTVTTELASHRHQIVEVRAVEYRGGVPYETAERRCFTCGLVIEPARQQRLTA